MEDNVPEQANVNTEKCTDCTMDISIKNRGESSILHNALDSVHSWVVGNKMELYVKKTKDMWISFSGEPPPPPVRIGDA
ncbi:Hypothetical predicted protein, partial [Paramuricea clavata]